MPRRKEPTRELSIRIDDENVRDALALWVKKYHGVDLDIKQIELTIDEAGKVAATAKRKPVAPEPEPDRADEHLGDDEQPRPF